MQCDFDSPCTGRSGINGHCTRDPNGRSGCRRGRGSRHSGHFEFIFECFTVSAIVDHFSPLVHVKSCRYLPGFHGLPAFSPRVLDHPLCLTRSGRAVLHSGRSVRANVVAIYGTCLVLGFAVYRESPLESGDVWPKTVWQIQGNQVHVDDTLQI